MKGAAVIFFAYIGFDAVSTAAEEVVDPNRDLPLGILGSLFVCTVLYISVAGRADRDGAGASDRREARRLASAFVQRGMNFVCRDCISLGAVAGLTSVLLVLLLGQSRVFFAISRDGLLPPAFSKIHPRFHTPYIPTIADRVRGWRHRGVAADPGNRRVDQYRHAVRVRAGMLSACGFCAASSPDMQRPFRTPLVPLVPILGVVFCALPDGEPAGRHMDPVFRLDADRVSSSISATAASIAGWNPTPRIRCD